MTQSLSEKIQAGTALVAAQAALHHRPIVMSSFGKDSMVLLALVQLAGLKLPIMFHREPHHPEKYEFANRVIETCGYSVYDYPPGSTGVIQNPKTGVIEVVRWQQVGARRYYMPIGVKPPVEGVAYLCGLEDLYLQPTVALYQYSWDLTFIGHKGVDRDIVLDLPALEPQVVAPAGAGCPTLCFPLRDFTNEDIWEVHALLNIPINHGRYDKDQGWKEREDISANPDYFHACTLCIDRQQGATVACPKYGRELQNISSGIRYVDPAAAVPDYLKLEKGA